jgi:hypothetical protein
MNDSHVNQFSRGQIRMFGRALKYTCLVIVFYLLATGPLLLLAGHAQENHQRNLIVENLLFPIVAADHVLTPEHPPLFSEEPAPFVLHREVMFWYWDLFGDSAVNAFLSCSIFYQVGKL